MREDRLKKVTKSTPARHRCRSPRSGRERSPDTRRFRQEHVLLPARPPPDGGMDVRNSGGGPALPCSPGGAASPGRALL